MEEDKTITIVNKAKSQMTYADYELAQENFRRKTELREVTQRQATGDAASRPAPIPAPRRAAAATSAPRHVAAPAPAPRHAVAADADARSKAAATIRQLHQLLVRTDLTEEDRAMLENRLKLEEANILAGHIG